MTSVMCKCVMYAFLHVGETGETSETGFVKTDS